MALFRGAFHIGTYFCLVIVALTSWWHPIGRGLGWAR